MSEIFVHETAEISEEAKIGTGTKIWGQSQVRENSVIGDNCIIGKGVYIDFGISIGKNVKIQNYANIYHGSKIEDDVFVGPGVMILNDKVPRSVTSTGELKGENDWKTGEVLIKKGASLGARSIILPGVVVGEYAMIAAGAVVTKDVPDYGLVMGNPAVLKGSVCKCGKKKCGDGEC